MKKIFAVLMALVTLFACAAVAEGIELVPVTFEDGFQVSLPADWLEIEPTEENLLAGIAYIACSPDGANTLQISWSELEGEVTFEELQAELATVYPDAEVYEINDIGFVGFTDEANNLFGYIAMDAVDQGMYTFWFTPASDEAFIDTAAAILGSVCNVNA